MNAHNKPIKSSSTSILCFGNKAAFDHPKIYLEIDPAKGSILCPYCNKAFVLISHDNKTPIR